MTRLRHASGFTLLEAMVAMAVLLIGSMGLLSLHGMGQRMNGDARIMTRATLIAQDLAAQMLTWDCASDGRLEPGSRSTSDLADTDFVFETDGLSPTDYDHAEGDLGAGWNGIPLAEVQALGFSRYWNIEEEEDTLGRPVGKRIAVIVRWGEAGRWRRIVLLSFCSNPQASLM